jgi:Rrf2 family iron-sulfur cluster assembly transcriptional regulator
MAWLAVNYGCGPVALAEVAARQRIPLRYLEHIARDLKSSGLVNSHRGVAGGYELALPPERITIADVLRALEGSVLATECGVEPVCSYSDAPDACVSKPLWEALQRQVEESLDRVTLASVAGRLKGTAVTEGRYNGKC